MARQPYYVLERLAGNRGKIDAVALAVIVKRYDSTKVGTYDAFNCAILQNPYLIPNDLLVVEGGPAIRLRLLDEVLHGATTWRNKQRLARAGIMIDRLTGVLLENLNPEPRYTEGVPRLLITSLVSTLEGADLVSRLEVDPKSQYSLARGEGLRAGTTIFAYAFLALQVWCFLLGFSSWFGSLIRWWLSRSPIGSSLRSLINFLLLLLCLYHLFF